MWRSITIPTKLLCPNRPISPPYLKVLHPMIDNPVLRSVPAFRETGMSHTIRLIVWILVEHTSSVVLAPIGRNHWIWADELELPQAVVLVI